MVGYIRISGSGRPGEPYARCGRAFGAAMGPRAALSPLRGSAAGDLLPGLGGEDGTGSPAEGEAWKKRRGGVPGLEAGATLAALGLAAVLLRRRA